MDPTTLILAALAVAGYFFFVKDDKGGGGGHGGRHGGHGGSRRRPDAPPGPGPAPGPMPGPAVQRAPAGVGPLLDQLDASLNEAMAQTDPDDVVSALKAAGQFGVTQVGPALDRQSQNRSKGLTTLAAHDNAMLQAIPTSQAKLAWWTAVLFPAALAVQLPAAAATSVLTPASSSDKTRAVGLARGMYEKYASAAAQYGGGAPGPAVTGYWGYATGIGTVIPSQYKKPAAGCSDASANPQLCATVASALMSETDPAKLRAMAASVAGAGFPAAANTLLAKADSLG